MKQRTYIAIDLKSFYASVECRERGLDPLDTNLVVADESRTDKTICLAVTPSLKSYGISGRGRLFEVKQRVKEANAGRQHDAPGHRLDGTSHFFSELQADPSLAIDFIIAPPRMAYYMEYSTRIYQVYLKYIAPEDIVVYSIDEVFMDVTDYLNTYKLSAHDLAMKIILDVLETTGITATAGIGTNLFLCKVAMDIVAKHIPADKNGVRIAELDEMKFRRELWAHQPLTDFWRVGRGIAKKLEQNGMFTMGDVALCSERNEDLLYKLFGKNAELLIDHAWGWEPTTIEAIKDKIVDCIKQGKLREVSYVRDETDIDGLKIAIDLKRGSDPEKVMQKLFRMTPLQDNYSCNFNILVGGAPRVMGVREILEEWSAFRLECVRRRLVFDLQKKQEKLHLLLGLEKILLDIDKAIRIVRETVEEADVVPNLMIGFGIDEIQAEYVAEIKLRNINKEYILKRIAELDALEKEIKGLHETLRSDAKIKNIICKQLRNVAKKYGKPRKTEIIHEDDVTVLSKEDFIEDYPVTFFLTKENYFKKISQASLRMAGEQKLKEEDVLLMEQEGANRMDLLFFSNQQNVYKLKASDVADAKASALGDYLPNLLQLDAGETIIYMTATADYSGQMVFFFANGKAAKVPLSAYETKTNRRKLVNAYSARAELVRMAKIAEEADFMLMRNADKATLLNTELIPLSATKNAGGVQVFTLKKNSAVTAVFAKAEFETEEYEYYRTKKIPTTGHFIQEKDKTTNHLPGQMALGE